MRGHVRAIKLEASFDRHTTLSQGETELFNRKLLVF